MTTPAPTPDPAPLAAPELSEDVRAGVFVVIAAYNESTCLREVVQGVRALYPNVVVVDDGSSDATFTAARDAGAWALRHVINRGQGAALQTGIEFALASGAAIIVTFDADGQHCVEDIGAMVAPIARGECDITLGSRFLDGASKIPTSRRIMLRLAVWFTRVVSRVRLTDTHNGFRAFSRRAAGRIRITLDRMAHASELIDQIQGSGFAFREVPVRINYTAYSMAKGQSSRGAIGIALQYLLGRVIQ